VTRRRLDPRVLGALAVLLALGAALVVFGGGDDDDDPAGRPGDTTTTTLAVGDLEIDAAEGWDPIPLPSLGFGLALPPGWEATRTDEATLDALAGRQLANPGFVDSARNAAASGAVLYGAHQDGEGRVSDVKVLVLPRPGATSAAELRELADGLVEKAELRGAVVTESTVGDDPVVAMRYDIAASAAGGEGGAGGAAAVGTQILRAGDDAVVSLIVTSEDTAAHDALAESIARTLALSAS
jgi:hypothetical protein